MRLPGKTLFLIYSLVRRLGEKQAVALQFLDGTYFYALFKDTVTVHSLDDALPLYECPTLWALCDSNDDVESPDSIFKRQRGSFPNHPDNATQGLMLQRMEQTSRCDALPDGHFCWHSISFALW
jgi:hypothetical protein